MPRLGVMTPIAAAAEACAPLRSEPMDAQQAEKLAAALKVIAHPARLRLLSLMSAQPEHEACVCHLTEPLGLAQSTVSHHLKVLHEAGLVRRRRHGTWVYYQSVEDGLTPLIRLLT
jgi:ArsR family transcriptional regulator, arsenate/arsenite/antimonite-responsive transcriptional repressor